MKPILNNDIDKLFIQMKNALNKKDNIIAAENSIHLPEHGAVINLPADFTVAAKEKISELFLFRHRPEFVLIHSKEAAGFTFQTIDTEKWSEKSMDTILNQLRETLQQTNQKQVFYDKGQIKGEIEVGWFDYKSFAVDNQIYNIMFLFAAGERFVMGTFYCLFPNYESWKPRVLRILQSIRNE